MAWLPTERLADKPAIKTIDDVSLALGELAAIETRRTALQAELDAEIEHVKNQHDKQLTLKLSSGKDARFDDREQLLRTAVEEYAAKHRDEILIGKTKSRKLPHGEIGWRAKRKSVSFADGLTEKDVLKRFEKRDVTKLLNKCLAGIKWFAGHLGLYLKVKLTLDKTGILKAHESGTIGDKCLQEAGLCVAGGEDEFFLSLNEYKADRVAA